MTLQIDSISKTFRQPDSSPIEVIRNISFDIERGDTLSVTGPSGSGKTTLLSLMAGLDRPDSGSIVLDGRDLSGMNEDGLAKYRAGKIGIVFQQFHLMPHLSVEENVSLPLEILRRKNIAARTEDVLERVGLTDRRKYLPSVLSGGECQRVAIARALGVEPSLLLADEPTGNLDSRTAAQIEELLFDLVESNRTTLVVVTHNMKLAKHCRRQLKFVEGKLA